MQLMRGLFVVPSIVGALSKCLPRCRADEGGEKAKEVEDDENADDDAEVDEAADLAVETALTETAKSPARAAVGQKRSGTTSKVRTDRVCIRMMCTRAPVSRDSARPNMLLFAVATSWPRADLTFQLHGCKKPHRHALPQHTHRLWCRARRLS